MIRPSSPEAIRPSPPGAARPRVALVTNVLAHYRVPCFERLKEALGERVTFFLLTGEMEHRRYVLAGEERPGLPVVTLDQRRRWRRPPYDDLHWNDVGPVVRGGFDVLILGGWSEPTYLLLWLRHLLRSTRILFWVESTAADFERRPLREAIKRILLKRVSGCIVPGHRAREYCGRLGVGADRVFVAPNATDGELFRLRAAQNLPRRRALREEFDLSAPSLLFVGRLVESMKDVATLLRAVAELERRKVKVTLSLAGDGPDRQSLEARATELGCRDVRFLGTLDHEELSRDY